jgi:hypothetical protein
MSEAAVLEPTDDEPHIVGRFEGREGRRERAADDSPLLDAESESRSLCMMHVVQSMCQELGRQDGMYTCSEV